MLSKEERKELESLKRDLVDPVKSFVGEVYSDTVGDAKRFYSGRARQARQSADLVRKRTEAQMAVLAQKREAQQRRRMASMKKTGIILALVVLIGILFVSIALSARAEGTEAPSPAPAPVCQPAAAVVHPTGAVPLFPAAVQKL